MSLSPGAQVGPYRVLEPIGAGAMGEVFLAIDDGLGRKVALKILAEGHRDNPELRARFVREARAVAAIAHPNVVHIYSTGEHDGRPYLAMEYLKGQDLGTFVRGPNGPLDSKATVAVLLDAARGLDAAAKSGMIHRDVKPTNLFRLDETTLVKVTDFGLAKPADPAEDPGLTALGVVVGTPDYIAPEQARGDDIDHRVDIYALGCTLYFLLVGRAPFRRGLEEEDKYLKVVARHLREPPPDPRTTGAPDTDDELAELGLQMMAKGPEERPSYDQVIARGEKIAARLARGKRATRKSVPLPAHDGERTVRRPSASLSAASAASAASGEVVPRRRSNLSRLLWATTGFSMVLFAGGLGLFLFGPSSSHPARAPQHLAADAGPTKKLGTIPTPVEAPPGMLVVTDEHGQPIFFVARKPVTNREYAELVKTHKFAAADADRPVLGVNFDYAAAYAKLRGRRLLKDTEWPHALDMLGFSPAGMRIWEWVDDGDHDPEHEIRRVNGGVAKHANAADQTITFRLADDLPGVAGTN